MKSIGNGTVKYEVVNLLLFENEKPGVQGCLDFVSNSQKNILTRQSVNV